MKRLAPLKKLNDLSLRRKLLIGVVVIVGVLALFGVMLFARLLAINNSFVGLDDRYNRLKSVLVLEIDNKQLTGLVKTDVLKRDPKLETQYNRKSLDLDNSLEKLKTTSQDPQEKEALARYEKVTGLLKGTELLILAEVREADQVRARNLFDSNYEDQQAKATEYLTDLVANESQIVSSSIAANRKQVSDTQLGLTVTLLFLAIAIALMVLVFGRDIVSAIGALNVAAAEFAKGNLQTRVALRRGDEIGSLGEEFNDMAVKVGESYDQLNQEKTRFLASINSLNIGFLMTFLDTKDITYNPALTKIFEHDISSDHKDANHPMSLELLQQKMTSFDLIEAIKKCQQTGQAFSSTRVYYADRFLSISGAPILTADSMTLGTVILIEDITEAKVMERSKDEFFSIASHELRTPLTSIKGNSSMILDFYKDTLKDPQLREMVEDMHESSERLIEIVNDFLDVSRLEQGKMSFDYKAQSIEEVIESVAYEMKPVLREKKLYLKIDKLTLDKLPKVWADKNRLKQVVYNLIGNAAKFTDEGGITISSSVEAGFVKVFVTDSGKGMTSESQQLLFHKFQQASSSLLTRDTTRGTGLGLYISKMIVENMGGVVKLEESTEGKGSIFSFTVPILSPALVVSLALKSSVNMVAKTDTATGLTIADSQSPEQIQPQSENR